MFANSHDIKLLATRTKGAKIAWKVFNNSITLILVANDNGTSDLFMQQILEFVFNAMVLLIGLDDLINIKNVERLKRELRCCYQLFDCLLEHDNREELGDVVAAADVMLSTNSSAFKEILDSFVDAADSTYGCILVHGKVVAATKKWWELTGIELVLISLLISTLPQASSRDIPVFLPQGSPTVPHRLCTLQLTPGVHVCILCGPVPSLAQLTNRIEKYWHSALDLLRDCTIVYPRNFPHSIVIDSSILGFILVNTNSKQCLCSVQISQQNTRRQGFVMSYNRRRAILRAFYMSSVGHIFRLVSHSDSQQMLPSDDIHERLLHGPKEAYQLYDTHSCYAIQTHLYRIFILYNKSIPLYAIGPVTKQTLIALTKDKNNRI